MWAAAACRGWRKFGTRSFRAGSSFTESPSMMRTRSSNRGIPTWRNPAKGGSSFALIVLRLLQFFQHWSAVISTHPPELNSSRTPPRTNPLLWRSKLLRRANIESSSSAGTAVSCRKASRRQPNTRFAEAKATSAPKSSSPTESTPGISQSFFSRKWGQTCRSPFSVLQKNGELHVCTHFLLLAGIVRRIHVVHDGWAHAVNRESGCGFCQEEVAHLGRQACVTAGSHCLQLRVIPGVTHPECHRS